MPKKKQITNEPKPFTTYEFIQKSCNGGFPIPNGEAGFEHGDPVLVVKKRELMEFMAGVREMVELAKNTQHGAAAVEALNIIDYVLSENQFVAPLRKLGEPKDK